MKKNQKKTTNESAQPSLLDLSPQERAKYEQKSAAIFEEYRQGMIKDREEEEAYYREIGLIKPET